MNPNRICRERPVLTLFSSVWLPFLQPLTGAFRAPSSRTPQKPLPAETLPQKSRNCRWSSRQNSVLWGL